MSQHNFLLIGLGGTGCSVVRELKKKLYVEWRSRGNSGPYPEIYEFSESFSGERVESRIATLSVDSNEKDIEGQGERSRKWRVFGESLRLADKEKVLIDPSGLGKILGNVERYPGIEPWIGDEMDFVGDITRGSTEAAGCNQIRRMGRLALACGNSIENVVNRVGDRLTQLSKGGEVGAEIHIACTIAAGTGSGILIDTIAQLQRYIKNQPGEYNVFIHAFATAKDVGSADVGNFHANQYSALLELNALRLGLYEPWDIRAPATAKRLAVPLPGEPNNDMNDTFKSVALITDTTEGGMDVPLDHQIENAAEFIFQVAVRQMGDLPKELRDAISFEDRKQYPADANGGNRSNAFIGYGVQRVAIPEREIREKLAYSVGRQFLLQVIYNNWDSRYRETPRSFSKDGFINERRSNWRVTKKHLCLDLVEETVGQPDFDTYEIDWRNELSRQQTRVTEQLGDAFNERQRWLVDFDRRAETYWGKGFRSSGDSGGVNNYFQIRRDPNEVNNRARRLRRDIESDLIEGMERRDSDYTLHHLPGALEFLVQRIEKDLSDFSEESPRIVEAYTDADRTREEIRREYQKIGRLSIGNKHGKLFTSYLEATTRFYYYRTLQQATDYAQSFCKKLIEELKSLYQQVSRFDLRMKQIASNFEDEINERIRENEEDSSREEVVYLVDAEYVNDNIRSRFESNKSVLDSNTDATIKALQKVRGDRSEFSAYLEKMPVDETTERVGGPIADEIRRISEEKAIESHDIFCENENEFEGIFGQNIVRKLYNDYGGQMSGELEQWIKDIMNKAMPMVSFDPNEEPMDLPTQGPVLRRCVFVPKCKDVPEEFGQHLRQKVESILGGKGSCKEVETYYQEMPEERNPSEIAIISVAFFFPARCTRLAQGLKERYLKRLQQKSEKESGRAYFEVHTESHQPRLPDLMKLGRREELEERMPSVLLATALDLMQIPEENGKQILFGIVDNFGRVKDKVESGMKMSGELREAVADSKARFGQEIPVETIILYSLYFDQFREGSFTALEKLVQTKMKDSVITEDIEQRLETMSGHCFLLSGKKEEDKTYALFDKKTAEATEFARRLADKSAL
ncbi:MAG: hypothetical protein GY749_19270 [Desulfobacteraceae bacterium]|nr:hypothetical protein [Desulfobacteraceae bacterium]